MKLQQSEEGHPQPQNIRNGFVKMSRWLWSWLGVRSLDHPGQLLPDFSQFNF